MNKQTIGILSISFWTTYNELNPENGKIFLMFVEETEFVFVYVLYARSTRVMTEID